VPVRRRFFVARLQEEHKRLILQAIASGQPVTQRSLARQTGVALGLTNLLIRRLVSKGYLKMAKAERRHVRYLMTAGGWEALARATRQSLEHTVHLFGETRDHIRATLREVSRRCPVDAHGQKRIVFYGAGNVAEIAYVSLQGTDLALVGVIDDVRVGPFFVLDVVGPDRLTPDTVDGVPYSHLVVTSLSHGDEIRETLARRALPPERISCL
jgi:DNA-binding MarR family transcriptional regulator